MQVKVRISHAGVLRKSAQEAGQLIAVRCATHALESPEGGLQTNCPTVLELPNNQDAGLVSASRQESLASPDPFWPDLGQACSVVLASPRMGGVCIIEKVCPTEVIFDARSHSVEGL
jgi:hypothetical protein